MNLKPYLQAHGGGINALMYVPLWVVRQVNVLAGVQLFRSVTRKEAESRSPNGHGSVVVVFRPSQGDCMHGAGHTGVGGDANSCEPPIGKWAGDEKAAAGELSSDRGGWLFLSRAQHRPSLNAEITKRPKESTELGAEKAYRRGIKLRMAGMGWRLGGVPVCENSSLVSGKGKETRSQTQLRSQRQLILKDVGTKTNRGC